MSSDFFGSIGFDPLGSRPLGSADLAPEDVSSTSVVAGADLTGSVGYDPLGLQSFGSPDAIAAAIAAASPATTPLPSVLPPNASAFERRLESAAWRLRDEGPAGVRSLWNPQAVPATLLPWLAWAFGVDAWDPAWAEENKRAVTASALVDHRIDGTLAGVRRVTGLYGGSVTKVVRPPCQLYYGAKPTQAQIEAELAVYPQLILRTGTEPFAAPDGATFPRRSYMGNCYGVDLDSAARMLPRAFLEDRGTRTECAVSAIKPERGGPEYLQVQMPVSNPFGTYAGGFPRFGVTVDAPVYILRTTQSYAGPALGVNYKLVNAGIDPTQVFPDWISETYPAQGFFPGVNWAAQGGYWHSSEASRHVYARLYLFDAARTLEARGKSFFLDAVHTGIQAHTARIRTWFPVWRSPSSPGFYGQGYFVAQDYAWLARYLDALSRCTSLRDTILVDTRNYAVVSCGPTACDPAVTCGAMLPV